MGLSPGVSKELLRLSRSTLEKFVRTGEKPVIESAGPDVPGTGLFVTLHRAGELRGCIGSLVPRKPFSAMLQDLTVAAASEDPRFLPVEEGELNEIEIELSILTPLEPIDDVSQIEVGKHGLCVVKHHKRGVLLPQVATEQGWDRERFVSETCRKAGLPADAWKKPGLDLYVFESEKLSERRKSD